MATHPLPSAESICRLLACRTFGTATELALQDGIESALAQEGLEYSREHVLGRQDRPDFLVGAVAVEVKTKGSLALALRQIARYLAHPEVAAVVLVGTPAWLKLVPGELAGKPVYSVRLLGSLL